MMHYKKGKNVEEELSKETIPIECLPKDFLWMHVKGGTTVSNVVDYAKKALGNGEYRSVVYTGSGGGFLKTISCAEILKRSHDLHQVTRICFSKVEEYWDPLLEGLEQIVATREVPCVHILLSLDEIDPNTVGYQHSKIPSKLLEDTKSKKKNEDRSRPGPSGRNNRDRPRQDQQKRKRKPKRDNPTTESPQTDKAQKESMES